MRIKTTLLAGFFISTLFPSLASFAGNTQEMATPATEPVPGASGPPAGRPMPPAYRGPGYHRPPPPWSPGYGYRDPGYEMWRMQRELRRWQREVERRRERVQRKFDDRNRPQWDSRSSGIEIRESFRSPRIRIGEDADNYIVTAEIPGAEEQSIQVEQRGHRLRIVARRQVEQRETSPGKRLQASFSSRYQRIIALPGPVRETGMQTAFENEVLTIRVPKAN